MSEVEEQRFREVYEHWAQSMEKYQRQIIQESAQFVEDLKKRCLPYKTKNEIATVVKGLQATVKSVAKVIGKYTDLVEPNVSS